MELTDYFNNQSNLKGLNKSMRSEKDMVKNQSELSRAKKRGNFILRQELGDYTPECNIKVSIICNAVLAVIFLAFGVPIIMSSETIKRLEVQYDKCVPRNVTISNETRCEIEFTLDQLYKAPVRIYYKLDGYFSNNREYAKSRIWSQLRGEGTTNYYLETRCDSFAKNSDLFGNDTSKLLSFAGKPLDPEGVLNPCGKIARNVFTDEFVLYTTVQKIKSQILINETGIAYDSDRTMVYKRAPDYETTQWIDVENEHFINWMNMETFPTFSKKWGRVEDDLKAGTYILYVDYKWNMTAAGVGKYFVLSSSEGLGSASFFGWALVKAALISVIAIVLLILGEVYGSVKFEENNLLWN